MRHFLRKKLQVYEAQEWRQPYTIQATITS